MLRPAMSEILKEGQSYYSFVVAISKRARKIVEEYENNHQLLERKAVKMAVEEFANGDCELIEDPNIGYQGDCCR